LGHSYTVPADKVEAIEEKFGRGGSQIRVDGVLLKTLFAEGMNRDASNGESDHYALDRWLAPRLHSALRISRRIASDPSFWAWIAMKYGAEYVHARFAKDGRVNAWRFNDSKGLLRNAISRLWWAAELVRNGPDYSAVDDVLRRVVTAQYALELEYSWYRPAAIAFTNVAEGNPGLSLDEMRELSKRANAYLPLTPIEVLGSEDSPGTFDETWWTSTPTTKELLEESLPEGPSDGFVSATSISALEEWLISVHQELKSAAKLQKKDKDEV
jgi:hypothetical protein